MLQGPAEMDTSTVIPDVVWGCLGITAASVRSCEVFWDGLGDCYEQGLVKAVGVSNYGSLSHDSCMTCQNQTQIAHGQRDAVRGAFNELR